MYIVIVGAGSLGYYLAELLIEEKHDIVVVDKDEEKCQELVEEMDVVATHGDGTDPKILEGLDIDEADAVVALTESDETNMVISLLAKELGANYVATRISRVEYDEQVLKKLGIDIVIHPEAAAAGYIAELITKPEVLDLAFISRGEAEILEIKIGKTSKVVGKKVREIESPQGSAIVALIEGSQLILPNPETNLGAGNKVLVLAKREAVEKVRKMLG